MSAETRKRETMGLLLLLLTICLGTDNAWGLLSRFSVQAFHYCYYCSSPTSSLERTRRLSPMQDDTLSPFGTNTYARGSVFRTIVYATGSSSSSDGGGRDSEKDKKNAANRKKSTARAELTGWGMNFQEPSSSFSSFMSSSKRKRGVKAAAKSENANWNNPPRGVFSLELRPPTGQSSSSSSKMMPRSKNKSAVASKKSVYQSADPQKLIRLTDYLKSGPVFPKSTSTPAMSSSSSSSELFAEQRTANVANNAAPAPSVTTPSFTTPLASTATLEGVALDRLAREWAAMNKDPRDDRAASASAGAPRAPPPPPAAASSLPLPSGGTMSAVSMDRLAQEWAAINRDVSGIEPKPATHVAAAPAPVVARGTSSFPSMDDLAKAWKATNKDTDSHPKPTPPIPYSPPLPPQPQPKAAPIPRGATTKSMDDLAKAWAAMTKETDSPMTPPIPYSPPPQSQPKAVPALAPPTGVTTSMDDLAKAWSSMNIDQDAAPRLPNVKLQAAAAFVKPTPPVQEPSSTPLAIPATMDDIAKAWASRNTDPDAAPRPPNVKN